MKSVLTACFLSLFLLSPAASANDFSNLKNSIVGYRNLVNTPIAPDVTFINDKGEKANLADFRGKTVLLNLWATWCPPCIREMPALNELAAEFKEDNFVVLAIATGRQGRETPDEFLQKRNLTSVLSYMDPAQDFLRLMEISSLPVSFLIAPDGTMRGGVIGMTEWNTLEAKKGLRLALKK